MKWLMKRDLFSSLHTIDCDQLGSRFVLNNENIYVMIVLIILQNITAQWY